MGRLLLVRFCCCSQLCPDFVRELLAAGEIFVRLRQRQGGGRVFQNCRPDSNGWNLNQHCQEENAEGMSGMGKGLMKNWLALMT
jgi:hypothetical protein